MGASVRRGNATRPTASGYSAQAQSAATLVANSAAASPLGQSAATLGANSIAANTADIIQMGNVVANDPPIPKRVATAHHTVFNMRHAVILSDTHDAKLARASLTQARDPAFEGHWSAHIQKTALRLI
jgi:3-deoxy-D-arabino-heptulosonate 7-phosphate (DAHP) synthase